MELLFSDLTAAVSNQRGSEAVIAGYKWPDKILRLIHGGLH